MKPGLAFLSLALLWGAGLGASTPDLEAPAEARVIDTAVDTRPPPRDLWRLIGRTAEEITDLLGPAETSERAEVLPGLFQRVSVYVEGLQLYWHQDRVWQAVARADHPWLAQALGPDLDPEALLSRLGEPDRREGRFWSYQLSPGAFPRVLTLEWEGERLGAVFFARGDF